MDLASLQEFVLDESVKECPVDDDKSYYSLLYSNEFVMQIGFASLVSGQCFCGKKESLTPIITTGRETLR